MQSTFTGIEIGKRSLNAHNQALNTVGHNLSNSSTEGYSRQRVELGEFYPIYDPAMVREETPGQIGQGVMLERIERVRDNLLENRIDIESGFESYWNTRSDMLLQLEQIYNEPGASSVRGLLDKFWEGWQELSLRPSDASAREAVLQRGEALAYGIRDRYRRLVDFRAQVDMDVHSVVTEINSLTGRVADLNKEIQESKALGDSPNDLMDRRDLLVEKLANLTQISVDQRDPDEFMIHSKGQILVQGKLARTLELRGPDQDGYEQPYWKDTGSQALLENGKLGALLGLRDGDAKSEIQTLDVMSLSIADLVNETHRKAYGLNGKTGQDFFSQWPFINNVDGNYDRNGDGAYDSTWVYRITGTQTLGAQAQVGIAGTMSISGPNGNIAIAYNPVDTVSDIVERINNAHADVTARLTQEGALELRAVPSTSPPNPDFVIRHIEDSGLFLTGYAGILSVSGPQGAFDWGVANAGAALTQQGFAVAPLAHPSGWIEVAPAIKSDINSIAAGFGNGNAVAPAGDGSAALAIAALRTKPVMVGDLRTFDDHFSHSVAAMGLAGESAQIAKDMHSLIGKNLRDTRDSISGVNMDEELANMIKFQHGYEAAAKFVTKVDSMLDTIINRMGV